MNKTWAILSASMVALSACVVQPVKPGSPRGSSVEPTDPGFDAARAAPAGCRVLVHVANDQIFINHEPVRTNRCIAVAGKFVIIWRMSAAAEYSFPANGIEFNKAPIPSPPPTCSVDLTPPGDYKCTFTGSSGLTHPYKINVLKNGVALPPLDPTVVNN